MENNMSGTSKILSVYVTDRGLPAVTREDIERLDILNVAFGFIEDGEITLKCLSNIDRVKEFRAWNPKLKIYLSTAGGQNTFSERENCTFAEAVKDSAGMEKLADSMVRVVREWDFDGIDIDWEYPEGEKQRNDHTLLLKMLREKLDIYGQDKHYGLSIAAGSKTWYFEITGLSESVQYLDYVNLMTYDINAGCKYTMHHSCPTKMETDLVEEGSTEENIELFLKNNVPPHKLIIGAAFYSRQWKNVEDKNHGLHSFAGEASDYGPGYTQLVREFVEKKGYTRYWDEAANAPYLFNGNNFITYEDEESLKCKCRLVRKWDIAGIMAWEYSCDEKHELLEVMRLALDTE